MLLMKGRHITFQCAWRKRERLVKPCRHAENIIFIACKSSKICQYYVNSMVISYSTCQKEEKECTWVKYLIYAFLLQFKICRNLRVFSVKSVFQKLRVHKKVFLPTLASTHSIRISTHYHCWNCCTADW